MAQVTVRFYASLREAAGKSCTIVKAGDLQELMELLVGSLPSLKEALLAAIKDRDRIVVLVNGHNIGTKRLSTVSLSEGDEIALFPPVSGG